MFFHVFGFNCYMFLVVKGNLVIFFLEYVFNVPSFVPSFVPFMCCSWCADEG